MALLVIVMMVVIFFFFYFLRNKAIMDSPSIVSKEAKDIGSFYITELEILSFRAEFDISSSKTKMW